MMTNTNSLELAASMLCGRDSAWLSVKQTSFLADVLDRETRRPSRGRHYFLNGVINDNPHGYQLNIASSGAGLLKPVECLGTDCRVCNV